MVYIVCENKPIRISSCVMTCNLALKELYCTNKIVSCRLGAEVEYIHSNLDSINKRTLRVKLM